MLAPVHAEALAIDGDDSERRLPSNDLESHPSDSKYEAKKLADDPFGAEDVAEVKYRTMKWWYVLFPVYALKIW